MCAIMNTMNAPNGNTDQHPRTLSLQKAAEYLGCSKAFLHGVCKSKEITHTRIGNRIKITILDLDLYRADHTVERQEAKA